MFKLSLIFWLIFLSNFSFLILENVAIAQEINQEIQVNLTQDLVGITINNNLIIDNITIKRAFNSEYEPINFQNWLISYGDFLNLFEIEETILEDGTIALISNKYQINKIINFQELTTDQELGKVISLGEIEKIFGITITFNLRDYALNFKVNSAQIDPNIAYFNQEPNLENLPLIQPPNFTLTKISQEINLSSRNNQENINNQGELNLVGSLLGGSWFMELDQPDLTNINRWQINQLQYYNQSNNADYVLGNNQPFWYQETGEQYWSFTTIQRQGFIPPTNLNMRGGFNINRRLQSEQINVSITGEATPGTLVQLSKGNALDPQPICENIIIRENPNQTNNLKPICQAILVDSSATYRFDNIPIGGEYGNNYQVLLYPDGNVNNTPIIEDAKFTNLPAGQLSESNSVWLFSVGMKEENLTNNLLGNFANFQGGIAYRQGISKNLTVGLGMVYDDQIQTLGEIFYQPNNNLQLSLSSLFNPFENQLNVNSNFQFKPRDNFNLYLTVNPQSMNYNINYNLSPNLSLIALGNSLNNSYSSGFQLNFNQEFSTFIRATLDNNNYLRWFLSSNLGQFSLQQFGNESKINSQLNYNLSETNFKRNNYLYLNHETNYEQDLLKIGWHYNSAQEIYQKQSLFNLDLSYGINEQDRGIIATIGTNIIPGLNLQMSYQELSLTNDQSSFNLNLISNLNFQQGISTSNENIERLRNNGGLLIKPFYDDNYNGIKDNNEQLYLENLNLLLRINNQNFASFKSNFTEEGIGINLTPNNYRLDLDQAGFPFNYRTDNQSYNINIIQGSYTELFIPFIPCYTITGIVTNINNKPLISARVELRSEDGIIQVDSITDSRGRFNLENLEIGKYLIIIDDKNPHPNSLEITPETDKILQINLIVF